MAAVFKNGQFLLAASLTPFPYIASHQNVAFSGDGTLYAWQTPGLVHITDVGSIRHIDQTGAWNDIKSVYLAPMASDTAANAVPSWRIDNFVEATLDFRNFTPPSMDVEIIGAKRGNVFLSDANSTVTWVAQSNWNAYGSTMTVYCGNGRNTINVTDSAHSALDDTHNTLNGGLWNPGYDGRYSFADINLAGGTDSVQVTGATRLFLHGGTGTSQAKGGDGDDIFYAGAGATDITGGLGADRFILSAGSGLMTVEDFTGGVDKIVFDHLNGLSVAWLYDTQNGSPGLKFFCPGTQAAIFLKGVSAAGFDLHDLIYT